MPTFKEQLDLDIGLVFLNPDDFAEQFTNGRTSLVINCIFDNEFAVILDDVETTAPIILVNDADIPGIKHKDLFTRVSPVVVYKVVGIQPDGTGTTVLILSQS